jgi:Zn2+/Cd2+-exporting ATPase
MKRYSIENLDCAQCALKIETELNRTPGVRFASVNFATASICLDTDNIDNALAVVKKHEPNIVIHENVSRTSKISLLNHDLIIIAVSILIAAGASYISLQTTLLTHRTIQLLYGIAWIIAGYSVIKTAVRNIFNGSIFDENFLMTLSTVSAFAIGASAEAASVMIFYKSGEYLQKHTIRKSRDGITSLLSIKSEEAIVLRNSNEVRVNTNDVVTGETIKVLAGMRIPLDGIILNGESDIDTSALTGESMPRSVKKGNDVYAGYININGSLLIEVSRPASESYTSRILSLVEDASQKKAKTEQFITRFARIYTPIIIIIASLIALLPPLITGASYSEWIYRACVLLVISCPCALVISIPLGYFGGIGGAARKGILLKGSSVIDALAAVKTVVFDKTGTLTNGTFSVQNIIPVNGYSVEDIRIKAASLCSASTHPVSKSISAASDEIHTVQTFRELPGMGIEGIVNGEQILVGNRSLFEKNNIHVISDNTSASHVYVGINDIFAGTIFLSDTVKKDSKEAISSLHRNNINTVMLTGDSDTAALRTAKESGILEYHAQLLPHQKVSELERIMKSRHDGTIAFVGDGINDAPVLARSDAGIAMGALGSDAAIESADAVIMTDSPERVSVAILHARKTRRIIVQNIILAFSIKGVFIVLGSFGLAQMWEAVFADTGVALLAVLNAMRVLR